MNSDNELMIHIYEASDMGIKSLTKLINILKKKGNKIKKDIESQLKEYECIYKSSKKLLDKNKVKKVGTNILTSLTANSAMSMELENDNSDAKVADILLRGYTMGIIQIEKKISDYKKDASKETLKLANKLLNFQRESTEILKQYL